MVLAASLAGCITNSWRGVCPMTMTTSYTLGDGDLAVIMTLLWLSFSSNAARNFGAQTCFEHTSYFHRGFIHSLPFDNTLIAS